MLVLSKKAVKLATNESWTKTSIMLLLTELGCLSLYSTEIQTILGTWLTLYTLIIIHILHTFLYKFPWVLTRKICSTIK